MTHRSGTARSNDDISLYWEVYGTGMPLVCSNGVGVGSFFWKYIIQHYQDHFAVLVWDYRGHGQSQRELSPRDTDMSIERHAQDFQAVLESAFPDYLENFYLIGHSMGCQVNLEIYRHYKERVNGIFHLLGTAGNALSTFGNFKHSPLIFRAIRRVVFKLGDTTNILLPPLLKSPIAWPFTSKFALVDPIYTEYEDFKPYLDHLATLDMQLFIQAIWACQEHSAWDLLPSIHCPVLVVAAERDDFTPIHCAEQIASAIPNGKLIVLADGSHAALIEQPEIINYHLDKYLNTTGS